MKKLKIAVIGAGQVARTAHINHYQSLPQAEVIAVCDTNMEAARQTAEAFGIPRCFDRHEELLEAVGPDAVSVCVPNKYHCEVTCAALEHGCHVLCEKPPAIHWREAQRMARTAEANNRLLTFGFHFRHHEHVAVIKNRIVRGDFGELYRVRATWLRRRGIPGWGNFTNRELQGGGPLIDIGIHMLDLAMYFLGYPKIDYVCGTMSDRIGRRGGTGFFGDWDKSRYEVEDGLFAMVKFADGASLNLETSFALNMKEKDRRNVELFGDRLGASAFPLEFYGEEDGRQYLHSYPWEEERDRHFDCIENFVRACLGEEPLLVTAAQAVYLQKLINDIYQSAISGKPVYPEGQAGEL